MTLKSALRLFKAIENGTIRKLGYGFLFAFYSNLSFIVSEIKRDIGRKSRFFILPAFDTPVRGSPSEYCHTVW